MIGHLGINVPDLAVAHEYYDRVLPMLLFEPFFSKGDEFSYRPAGGKPGTFLFFYPSLASAAGSGSQEEGKFSRHQTGLQHLAFILPTRAQVHAVTELVRGLGSEILHEPEEWPEYHPGYYASFWLDPFGFMLEAVCHKEGADTLETG